MSDGPGLARTNANLLVALDALLRERSVTRAARRLGVTQSAMSGTLAQLRALFDDPLLVRVGQAMEPTPRAAALAERLRDGVAALEAVLAAPRPFDAAETRARFVVAMNDYAELLLAAPLLRRLAADAPGASLQVMPWGLLTAPPGLAAGEVDLVVGFYATRALPAGAFERALIPTRFVTLVRQGHPVVRRSLSLATFLRLAHVVVTEALDADGVVDRALAALGHRRRVVARVPHFSIVPELVAGTDLVATVDEAVARHFEARLPLRLHPPPLELPAGEVGMVWHERTARDPARRWLRDVVAQLGARAADQSRGPKNGRSAPSRPRSFKSET